MFRRGFLAAIAMVLSLTFHAESSDSGLAPNRHVVAGGELMFVRPADFGLALHRDQLLVRSVIPPCDEGFDYCLYHIGEEFAGTNFKSAGIRIERREDLETAAACLFTPPRGYLDFQQLFAGNTT